MEVECLLSLGKLHEADECLSGLKTSINGPDPDVLVLKGKLALLQGNSSHAISFFSNAVDMEPANIQLALHLKGVALLRCGNVHLARKAFVQALMRDRTFTRSELALAGLHLYQNDTATAFEYLQRILGREPENAEAHLLKGIVHLSREEVTKAFDALSDAKSLTEVTLGIEVFEALAYERQGKTLEARKVYESVLASQRNHVVAALGMIRLIEASQADGNSASFFENLSLEDRQEPLYRYGLGIIHTRKGDLQGAMREYQKALELSPAFVAPYLKLAELYILDNAWEELVSLLEEGLAHQASSPCLFSQLSKGYMEMGKNDLALDVLEQGVAQYPHEAGLLSNLAWVYLEIGQRQEEALNLAQKAYSLCPENPAVADTLGWAFYKKNLLTRALWMFEQALEAAPDNPILSYHLGLVLHAKGDENRAAAAFEKSLQLGLVEPEKRNAQQKLASLRASG
jgi:tetratricopeptide (TPR) repeat protein